MRVAYPPITPTFEPDQPSVFLAGSIEMGQATDWQTRVMDTIADKDVLVLNPRRHDWDASWEQSIDNPHFSAQVNWELDMLERADKIIMYFDWNTKSPITLLELGMFANSGKLVVCCPDGFWRKGNVEVVCARSNIPLLSSLRELLDHIQAWV